MHHNISTQPTTTTMAMANLFTSYLLLFSFSLSFSLITSSLSHTLPPTFAIATTQLKYWSQNVKNQMPLAISTKLSPLTNLDSDYFSQAISQSNFNSDNKFCSLAKLACSSASDDDLYNLQGGKEYSGTAKLYTNARTNHANSLAKIDPSTFFRSSTLKQGNTIHLSTLKDSLPLRAFLPPKIASKLPLSLKGITQFFPHSPKDAIQTTLSYCNAPAVKGEIKSCPTSLEELITFSKTTLKASKLISLTSKSTAGSDTDVVIGAVKQFQVEKIVACHELFLPFATYYCHSLSSSKIYSVDLVEPETRTPVNTVMAVCHMDTSMWPEDHVAFEILKFRPGQGEACHWMNEIDLAWINAEVQD